MGRVDGKVAFITGAARGQGREHAVTLAREGADIIAVDVCGELDTVPYPLSTPDDLVQTAKLVEDLDRRIVIRQADVRDSGQLDAAVQAGLNDFGHIDIVCANAGILSSAPTDELTDQQWDEMIDVNLTGVWRTCKAVIPSMKAAGRGGSIILTSSVLGLRGIGNVAHYVAAKHGVVGLMRALAAELAGHNIRVNTVNPINVDTDMIHNKMFYSVFMPDNPNPTRADAEIAFGGATMMPIPWVQSSDISNAVLFLASDESRYITGVALPIDAGGIEKFGG